MRYIFAVLMLVFSSGAFAAALGEVAVWEASNAFSDCLSRTVRRIDDLRSPAVDIAKAAGGACAGYWARWQQAAGFSLEAAHASYGNRYYTNMCLASVFEHRAAVRNRRPSL